MFTKQKQTRQVYRHVNFRDTASLRTLQGDRHSKFTKQNSIFTETKHMFTYTKSVQTRGVYRHDKFTDMGS